MTATDLSSQGDDLLAAGRQPENALANKQEGEPGISNKLKSNEHRQSTREQLTT
jgi:hypothetical protein